MSAGYTKGPWKIGSKTKHERHIDAPNANVVGLAIVEAPLDGLRNLEMQANARLIAAAPELLEALEMCIKEISGLTPSGHAMLEDDPNFWIAEHAIGKVIENADRVRRHARKVADRAKF